jgi:hypothetical protein
MVAHRFLDFLRLGCRRLHGPSLLLQRSGAGPWPRVRPACQRANSLYIELGGLILPSGHVLRSGRQFKRVCLGWGVGLAGRSPVIADEDQKRALADLGQVRDWAETARPLVEPESVRLLGGVSERRRPDVASALATISAVCRRSRRCRSSPSPTRSKCSRRRPDDQNVPPAWAAGFEARLATQFAAVHDAIREFGRAINGKPPAAPQPAHS